MTVGEPVPTDPQTACTILVQCYRDGAGAEALLRAFLAERDCDRGGARFWIEVYGMIGQLDLSVMPGTRVRQ
jgi:hypothetical protein